MTKFRPLLNKIKKLPDVKGISASDILYLPDEIGRLVRVLSTQKTMTLEEIAKALDLNKSRTKRLLRFLIQKGYLLKHDPLSDGKPILYCVHFARMRKRNIPIDL